MTSGIWQAPRQYCYRDAFQIAEQWNNCKPSSRGFETTRDWAAKRLKTQGIEALVSSAINFCVCYHLNHSSILKPSIYKNPYPMPKERQ